MNVASFALCKELYELSGRGTGDWALTEFGYMAGQLRAMPTVKNGSHADYIPAYDLGYLLRKLPKVQSPTGSAYKYLLTLEYSHPVWNIGYPINGDFTAFSFGVADTPEDAACKLSIELFKQNVQKGNI